MFKLNSQFFSQETTLKNNLNTKKKKKKKELVKVTESEKDQEEANEQEEDEEDEEGDGNEGEQENSGHREKAKCALIPPKRGKLKRKTKVKEETLDALESPDNDEKPLKGCDHLLMVCVFWVVCCLRKES